MRLLQGPSLTWLNLVLLPAATLLAIAQFGMNHETIATGLHITARITLFYFLLAFSASALVRLTSGTLAKALMRNRRYIGLSAAISHGVHLGLIFCYFLVIHPNVFNVSDAAGGIVVYIALLIMTLSSNNTSVHIVGAKQWKRFHKLGMYLVFIAFMLRMTEGAMIDPVKYSPFVLLLLAAYLLRVAAWKKQRTARTDNRVTAS
ncbi:hypothetical protein A9Q99_11380 [Gammaproteobacteria bacterium 45_16_T64]|nr:hypothetical protein A9Q99_11380 [Gammaproteobacteria bacterium 45_16_T64]